MNFVDTKDEIYSIDIIDDFDMLDDFYKEIKNLPEVLERRVFHFFVLVKERTIETIVFVHLCSCKISKVTNFQVVL